MSVQEPPTKPRFTTGNVGQGVGAAAWADVRGREAPLRGLRGPEGAAQHPPPPAGLTPLTPGPTFALGLARAGGTGWSSPWGSPHPIL